MKKITKVLLVAVLVLMLVLPFTAKREKAYAVSKKPDYLTDQVGVISAESAKMIEEEAEKLQDKYGASVYSVIQDNYSGDIDDYSYDLFKEMGFETQDNCDVVLFIFEDAGEYWAIQGLGIEHEMDSERLSSLLANYFASAFSDYHTDKAILNFIDGMDLFYKDFFSKQNNSVDDTVIVDDFGNPIPNNGCYNCGYNCASCGLNCGRGCLGCGIGCGSCLTSCLRNCAYNCGGYGYGCGRGLGLFSCLTGGAFGSVFIILVLLIIVFAIFGSFGRRSYGYGYRPRPNFFFFGGPRRPRGPRPGGFGGPRHGGFGGGFGGPRPGGFGGGSRHSGGFGGSRPGGSHGGSSGSSRGAGGKR